VRQCNVGRPPRPARDARGATIRIFLICNPGSGSGPDIEATTADLERLGAEVLREEQGAERVLVVGGDGSIGPGAEVAARLELPLAVAAAGTANDFARAHDLPEDVDAGLELAVRGTATTELELARIDGRPFVNAASAGLAPAAARRAKPFKRVLGPGAYSAGALMAGLLEAAVAVTATVDGDAVFEGEAWQVTVASSGAFGGGSEIEEADAGDGRLDLIVVPGSRRLDLPKTALAMRNGTVAQMEDVVHRRGSVVELRVPPGTAFNVDGEVVEAGEVVRFTVQPAAYDLVVPR
jgi:diacylglycerol kinase (ATP)